MKQCLLISYLPVSRSNSFCQMKSARIHSGFCAKKEVNPKWLAVFQTMLFSTYDPQRKSRCMHAFLFLLTWTLKVYCAFYSVKPILKVHYTNPWTIVHAVVIQGVQKKPPIFKCGSILLTHDGLANCWCHYIVYSLQSLCNQLDV